MHFFTKRYFLIILAIILLAIVFWFMFMSDTKAPANPSQASTIDSINPNHLTTSGDATIPWEKAIKILRSGEVDSISQYQNLKVILMMKNGDEITTTEPSLNEVVTQIEICGDSCKAILVIEK